MALIHGFKLFESKDNIEFNEDVRQEMTKIEDYLILYIMDSLN